VDPLGPLLGPFPKGGVEEHQIPHGLHESTVRCPDEQGPGSKQGETPPPGPGRLAFNLLIPKDFWDLSDGVCDLGMLLDTGSAWE
jgi:hypothetical protein